MLEYNEWRAKKAEFNYPCTHTRASGKTFRALLQAANAVSLGDRVTVWCHTNFVARHQAAQFINMFHNWGFVTSAHTMVRNRHTSGFVVFSGIGGSYEDYYRHAVGNRTHDIFDV